MLLRDEEVGGATRVVEARDRCDRTQMVRSCHREPEARVRGQRLRRHPVQVPAIWDALQLVPAVVFEDDS
jgi:hypothetical protein